MKKTKSVYRQQLKLDFPLLTEPNQSFTPRQIIDQFSRGELSAKAFEPSDSIDSESYSDDNMVDNIIEFEDEFQAIEFMNTTKVKKKREKDVQSQNDEIGSIDSSGSSGEEKE